MSCIVTCTAYLDIREGETSLSAERQWDADPPLGIPSYSCALSFIVLTQGANKRNGIKDHSTLSLLCLDKANALSQGNMVAE